jgi:hypothetical protein
MGQSDLMAQVFLYTGPWRPLGAGPRILFVQHSMLDPNPRLSVGFGVAGCEQCGDGNSLLPCYQSSLVGGL